ncbi:hypothetical protein [Priestia aryabhattai]|uniref:hypothetical protein n=1 Tax=Priestia aryabhattai TaxID=412384 RepID=UPI0023AEC54D|nr:hypothetical protein [Priestia aryabhattai]MDE8676577.1 hypothetical protein [Priestia aryabhattai]
MKKIKCLVSGSLVVALSLGVSSSISFAEENSVPSNISNIETVSISENNVVFKDDNKEVTVNMENNLNSNNVDINDLKYLVDQANSDGFTESDEINVYDVSYDEVSTSPPPKTEQMPQNDEYGAEALLYSYNTTKFFSDRSPGDAKQIISVAYGQTSHLSKSKTVTAESSYTASVGLNAGAHESLESSLRVNASKTYTKSTDFKGPSKKGYSRMYYATPFYDRGSYNIYKTNKVTGKSSKYATGDYREASKQTPIYSWSKDYKN